MCLLSTNELNQNVNFKGLEPKWCKRHFTISKKKNTHTFLLFEKRNIVLLGTDVSFHFENSGNNTSFEFKSNNTCIYMQYFIKLLVTN